MFFTFFYPPKSHGNHGSGGYAAGPLRVSEKELTKGAKRILDDTEESGTRRWEFTMKNGFRHFS